jgi:hypothetical protein
VGWSASRSLDHDVDRVRAGGRGDVRGLDRAGIRQRLERGEHVLLQRLLVGVRVGRDREADLVLAAAAHAELAAADRGLHGLDPVDVEQRLLGLGRLVGGLLEVGAGREGLGDRGDVLPGVAEEADVDQHEQGDRAREHEHRRAERQQAARQRVEHEMQQGRVHPVQPGALLLRLGVVADRGDLRGVVGVDALVALRGLQEPVREHGHDRQRHQQRGEHRDADGEGEGPEQLPGHARDDRDRQEHDDGRERRGGDGAGDLADGVEDRAALGLAVGEVAHDVLDHDDRVVDHAADRDRERRQGQHVQRVPGDVHADEGDQQRGRDRDRGDDRRPHPAQEQQDHADREEQTQQALLGEGEDRLLDEGGLVEDHVGLGAAADAREGVVEDALDVPGDVHDVAVDGRGDHEDERLAAVGARDGGGLLGGLLDGGDLAEGDRGGGLLRGGAGLGRLRVLARPRVLARARVLTLPVLALRVLAAGGGAVGRHEHDALEALEAVHALPEHDVHRAVPVGDGAAGQRQAARVQGGGDVVLGEASLGERVLVRGDPDDLRGRADHGDRGDPVDALELGGHRGLEAGGEVGGLQVGGDREHDGGEVARATGDDLRIGVRRELVLDPAERRVDLVRGAGDVGAVGELDGDHRQARLRGRGGALDVLEPRQRLLDRSRDPVPHLLGGGAGGGGHHLDLRQRDRGDELLAHRGHDERADDGHGDADQRDEGSVVQAQTGQAVHPAPRDDGRTG